ncbi:hypothetical protein MTO96_006375 [Rhipicephalus appendiculatus]
MKPVFTLKILTPLALIFFLLILKQSPTYALAGKSFNAQSHTPAQSVGSGNHHRASGSVLATQRRHQRTAQDHQRVATYIRSSANLTDQRRGLYPQGIENPGYISDTETGTLSGPPKPPDPSLKPKLSSGAPPDPHRHLKPTKPPANRAPVPAPRKSKHGHDGESPVAPTPAPRLTKKSASSGEEVVADRHLECTRTWERSRFTSFFNTQDNRNREYIGLSAQCTVKEELRLEGQESVGVSNYFPACVTPEGASLLGLVLFINAATLLRLLISIYYLDFCQLYSEKQYKHLRAYLRDSDTVRTFLF